jgi:hypothetical protein
MRRTRPGEEEEGGPSKKRSVGRASPERRTAGEVMSV